MGSCQVQQLRVRVDLGAMEMKGYTAAPKAPALLKTYHIQDTRCGSLET